ncbi:uncharacterized protein LOC128559650 [Mercenaria mercenaria]|uniref:uncharacterized protein LOC128559650 n=1 Tax=Mercenaria mercenaria TaxID=6596 RepID=UPI00234F7FB6|nr:uncharacterized protein LOC128559650 [Mercenaria mercenaria]
MPPMPTSCSGVVQNPIGRPALLRNPGRDVVGVLPESTASTAELSVKTTRIAMAAAASAQKPCTWHIDELHEVAVYKDNEEYTNANIILDCFVTDKQNVELKSQKRAGRLRVIFPVPSRGQTQSRVILQETFTIFMSDYVREEDNFITVPIKHLETWTKSEFCEIILKEFLHLKEVRKQNYPVKLTFCSLESYSFDEAVKVCNTVIGRGHTESSAGANTGRQSRHVCFKYGCLDLEEADMVACTMSSTLNLENGIVSKALLDRAGGELQHEMNRDYPGGVRAGEIAVLNGYELKCSFVAFGVMAPWRNKTRQSDSAKEDYCRTEQAAVNMSTNIGDDFESF